LAADLLFGDSMALDNATLGLTDLAASFVSLGSKFTLIAYDGPWDNGIFAGYLDDSIFTLGPNQWLINYNDSSPGMNFQGDALANGNTFVTITAVPEPTTWACWLAWLCALAAYVGRKSAVQRYAFARAVK
jgi:hypothetical protein